MSWQTELDTAYENYKNRGKFSYDPEQDTAYKQYRQAYLDMGQLAMKDTVGKASSLTGGYGNSYATSAGAGAYMNYASQAAQALPTYRQMALSEYEAEGNRLLNSYNMASDGRNFEYQQERDRIADEQWQQEFDYQKSRDSVADSQWQQQFDYQKSRDTVSDSQWQQTQDRAYEQWLKEFDYQKSRDSVADTQWQQSFNYQKSRDAVADTQWQQSHDTAYEQWLKEYNYQKSRDAVADSQWQQSLNYQKERDKVADKQWKTELGIKAAEAEKKKEKEAKEDIKEYKISDWVNDAYELYKETGGWEASQDFLKEYLFL